MPGNEIGVVTCCCTCGYVEYVCIVGTFDVNVTLSFVVAYGCDTNCICCFKKWTMKRKDSKMNWMNYLCKSGDTLT